MSQSNHTQIRCRYCRILLAMGPYGERAPEFVAQYSEICFCRLNLTLLRLVREGDQRAIAAMNSFRAERLETLRATRPDHCIGSDRITFPLSADVALRIGAAIRWRAGGIPEGAVAHRYGITDQEVAWFDDAEAILYWALVAMDASHQQAAIAWQIFRQMGIDHALATLGAWRDNPYGRAPFSPNMAQLATIGAWRNDPR